MVISGRYWIQKIQWMLSGIALSLFSPDAEKSDWDSHRTEYPLYLSGARISAPRYLAIVDAVVPVLLHVPSRAHLRSAQRGHFEFDIPRSWTVFGSRSFFLAAPQAWNQVPADIHKFTTFFAFKRYIKTLLGRPCTVVTGGLIKC